MLDYRNWYLVELRRRLNGRLSSDHMLDILNETRAHLDERVAELVGGGMDSGSAERAALADFGDPDSVAQGHLGGMSSRAIFVWSAIASLPILAILTLLSLTIAQVPGAGRQLGVVPLLALPSALIILALVWRTRRWIGVQVSLVGLGAALIGSIFVTSGTLALPLRGSPMLISRARLSPQLATREAWLVDAKSNLSEIGVWIHSTDPGQRRQAIERLVNDNKLTSGPVRASWAVFNRERMLFGTQARRQMDPEVYLGWPQPYILIHASPDEAADLWEANGVEFVKFMRKQISDVSEEIEMLRSPEMLGWLGRWQLAGWPLVAGAAVYGLILILMNGLVILGVDGRRSLRKASWRRQLG